MLFVDGNLLVMLMQKCGKHFYLDIEMCGVCNNYHIDLYAQVIRML